MSSQSAAWPKAIVFDLDGTLVDSVADLAAALNAVLERKGLRAHTLDEVRRMIGGGVQVLLQRAHRAQGHTLADDAAAPLAKTFLAYYRPRATQTTALYPGAAELIEELARGGAKLAICTNKPTDISVAILETLGIAHHFAAIVGAEEGRPRKPDPAALRLALERLSTAPQESVMIGDSGADVGCARALGMPVIVVAYGYTQTPPEELGADALIAHLGEARAAIARLAAAGTVTGT